MISFVVLHYKNTSETLKCLEYLSKLHGEKSIIVVDNNTLDKTSEAKIALYTKDILKLDKNYGFAKANNKGINYAKKKYNPDFYITINNDVFITDQEILDKITKTYTKYHFDILGPFIDSPTKESVNPFPVIKTKEQLQKEITHCQKLIKIYQSAFMYFGLNIYLKVKHFIKKPTIPKNGKKLELNVPLHGCAIIFAKKYVEKYEYPFYNDTFLFHEEEFLYQRIIKDKLTSVYDPSIKVYHEESSSIKKSNKNIRLAKLFKEKERLKSLNLLMKEF